VQAAEQYFGSGHGTMKFNYVANFLQEKGLNVTQEDVRILIESAVKQMNDVAQAVQDSGKLEDESGDFAEESEDAQNG
jgi:hypothetical protein